MKKLTAMLLTLAMVFALAVPASAATSMNNFTEKKDTYAGFTDVPANAWYGDALKLCYESKLMQGNSKTTFNPLGNLTVAQAIVMAARLCNVYNGGTGIFEAPAAGEEWYRPALTYAMNHSIISKTEFGWFDTFNSPITRGLMAYLFYNALPASELQQINTVTQLPDVTEGGSNYSGAIFGLYRAGVLSGNDIYGTFAPNSTITRQAACAIIARAAFPAQRKMLDLYTKFTEGATTFAMPTGTTKNEIEGGTLYEAPSGNTAVIVTTDTGPYQGFSIATLTPSVVQQTLGESFAGTGLTASTMTTTLVKFGTVAAYRATFNVTDGTIQMPCCAYLYVAGSTLYMVIAMTASGSETLAALANAVTVNGSGVSVKLS